MIDARKGAPTCACKLTQTRTCTYAHTPARASSSSRAGVFATAYGHAVTLTFTYRRAGVHRDGACRRPVPAELHPATAARQARAR
eukprot:4052796-Pleurochrysis_carterae.AAC.1